MLQTWALLHEADGASPISQRSYWASVYALAIGTNYSAFSIFISASLAGIGWKEDLAERNVYIGRMNFSRINLPLVASSMAITCAALAGQVYIIRDTSPYIARL